jgi:hypothetical protein
MKPKPVILEAIGNPAAAWLVDFHSVTWGANGPGNKPCRVFLKAIEIRHLRAGQIEAVDGVMRFPWPCQLIQSKEMKQCDPGTRGIHPDAAAALLSMPLGHQTTITLGKTLVVGKGKPQGWDQWKFIIAWCWSLWQDERARGPRDANGWSVWDETKPGKHDSLELRWQVMKRMGYPLDCAAFRQACKRMNLFVTESKR